MKKQRIERYTAEDIEDMESRTDWPRIDALSDEDIKAAVEDDPDAELLPADWLETAEFMMPDTEKERITIRVDRDVVEYFRGQGSGYQTRMNAVLKAYVLSQRLKERR